MSPAAPAAGPVLRDIHLPAAPGWWPPAPGWWILAGIVLAVLVVLWRVWSRRRRLAQARVRLVQDFNTLLQQHPESAAARIADISLFLRRAGKREGHGAREHRWDHRDMVLAREFGEAAIEAA